MPEVTWRVGGVATAAEEVIAVDAEGEGELGNSRHTTSPSASTVSETAAMVLFRLSVPICIYASLLR